MGQSSQLRFKFQESLHVYRKNNIFNENYRIQSSSNKATKSLNKANNCQGLIDSSHHQKKSQNIQVKFSEQYDYPRKSTQNKYFQGDIQQQQPLYKLPFLKLMIGIGVLIQLIGCNEQFLKQLKNLNFKLNPDTGHYVIQKQEFDIFIQTQKQNCMQRGKTLEFFLKQKQKIKNLMKSRPDHQYKKQFQIQLLESQLQAQKGKIRQMTKNIDKINEKQTNQIIQMKHKISQKDKRHLQNSEIIGSLRDQLTLKQLDYKCNIKKQVQNQKICELLSKQIENLRNSKKQLLNDLENYKNQLEYESGIIQKYKYKSIIEDQNKKIQTSIDIQKLKKVQVENKSLKVQLQKLQKEIYQIKRNNLSQKGKAQTSFKEKLKAENQKLTKSFEEQNIKQLLIRSSKQQEKNQQIMKLKKQNQSLTNQIQELKANALKLQKLRNETSERHNRYTLSMKNYHQERMLQMKGNYQEKILQMKGNHQTIIKQLEKQQKKKQVLQIEMYSEEKPNSQSTISNKSSKNECQPFYLSQILEND